MLKGKYVGLRSLEKNDLPQLMDWRNNPNFRKNFREHRELNTYNQENWFTKTMNNSNDYMFTIVDLETGQPIGACGLLYTNWLIRSADFSFYIGKDELYIDKKYANDAAKLFLDYGFKELNLNKIWMELYEYDSSKIDFFIEIFKFKIDGKLRENAYYDGRYWDSFIISLLNKEYLPKDNER